MIRQIRALRTTGGDPVASARRAAGCVAASVIVLAGVAALGDSAAVPGLGPQTRWPPWDLSAGPPSALVTALLVVGYGLGATGVWLGLRAVAGGAAPVGRRWPVLAAVAAVALLVAVPPLGSADHLSYVAYGRIAAAGDDTYHVPPIAWRGGTDPVAGAVQPPWQHTPSVYGPVATAIQALVAVAGDGSLRRTVWFWQLLCAVAFLAVGGMLHLLTRRDPVARARALVLWTLNPLLLGQLVLGAHVDVVAAALALGSIALAARAAPRGLAAGVLLGAAVGIKLPYALAGLAAVWGLRGLPRREVARVIAAGAAGALAVLLPAHLWAGPHVFDQLHRASRMVSLATPWRAVVNLVDLGFGSGAGRAVVGPVALLLAAGLAWLLSRRLEVLATVTADPITGSAVRGYLLLAGSWVLTAAYALPWYDAMVWAPLALVGASWLDRALLVRLVVLCLAYLPGRVVGMSPTVETITLGARRLVAPVLILAVLVAVVRWGLHPSVRRGRASTPPGADPRRPAPAP